MKKILLLSCLILTACATAGDYQAECEKIHPKFPQMAECLKEKINADPRANFPANQAFVKRYLLEAEKLSQMVQKKKISEIDARIRLADLYLSLRGAQGVETQRSINNWQTQQAINAANTPRTTNCSGWGNSVTCTSY